MWVVACVRSAGHPRCMSVEAAHLENGEAPAPSPQSSSRPRPSEIAVASVRLGFGAAILVGRGVGRLVDAAVEASAAPDAPAEADAGSGVRHVRVVARAVQAAEAGAAVVGRAASTVGGSMPAVVREPVESRRAAWAALRAEERARNEAAAGAAIELAVGFMTDWIVERLDVNRIVERLRLDNIIANLELTDVIMASSGGVTGQMLDKARGRAVGADALVDKVMARARLRRAARTDSSLSSDSSDGEGASGSSDGEVALPPAPP
jgi:hypothetical protein